VTRAEVFEALDAVIADAGADEKAGLVVQLAARLAQVGAGLAGDPGRRWVAAEKVAEASGLDLATLKRWARRPSCTWASCPTRKTVLVDLDAFDRWLAAGRFRNIHGATRPKAAVSRAEAGTFAVTGARSRPGAR
jgi:hypothetical protein